MIVIGVRHFGVESVEAGGALCGALRATRWSPASAWPAMSGRASRKTICAPSRSRARPGSASPFMPANSPAWESVAGRARPYLRPSRIGHGVRAIENPDAGRQRSPTRRWCWSAARDPTSRLRSLRRVSTRIRSPACRRQAARRRSTRTTRPISRPRSGANTRSRAEHFGLGDKQLTALTRTAIEAAFLDKKTKADLLERLPAQRR